MSTPIVEVLLFDEDNEDKLWRHGLTPTDLLQMIALPHRIKRNRKARRATHLMIGRDNQGRCIAVPIEPTHQRTVWRPVTGWFCKPHEVEWLPWAGREQTMDEQELRELQEPTNWIDDEDSVRPPVVAPTAVISVAFSQSEIKAIGHYARDHGLSTTEFVRQTTLNEVNRDLERQSNGTLTSSGSKSRPTLPPHPVRSTT